MDARSSGLHTHRVRAASRGTEAKVTGVPGCVRDASLGRDCHAGRMMTSRSSLPKV